MNEAKQKAKELVEKKDFRPARECFKLSDKIRASHELFNDFQQERTDIQKFIFYLWLQDNELGAKRGKDENGNLGYGLEFVKQEITKL